MPSWFAALAGAPRGAGSSSCASSSMNAPVPRGSSKYDGRLLDLAVEAELLAGLTGRGTVEHRPEAEHVLVERLRTREVRYADGHEPDPVGPDFHELDECAVGIFHHHGTDRWAAFHDRLVGRPVGGDPRGDEAPEHVVEVAHVEADPVVAEVGGGVRRAQRRRDHPLEQIDHEAGAEAAGVVEDPRIPLRLVEAERRAVLGAVGLGVRRRRQSEEIPVEDERPLEVRAVHVHMEGLRHADRH